MRSLLASQLDFDLHFHAITSKSLVNSLHFTATGTFHRLKSVLFFYIQLEMMANDLMIDHYTKLNNSFHYKRETRLVVLKCRKSQTKSNSINVFHKRTSKLE